MIAHLVIDVLSVCKGVLVISRHQRGRQYRLIKQIEKVPGDIVIRPNNNSNLFNFSAPHFVKVDEKRLPVCCPIRTMYSNSHAGFYSDLWGEMPFSLAPSEVDVYEIYLAGKFNGADDAIDHYQQAKLGNPLQ